MVRFHGRGFFAEAGHWWAHDAVDVALHRRCRSDSCPPHCSSSLDVAQLGRVTSSGPGSVSKWPVVRPSNLAVETISRCSSVWQSAWFGTRRSPVRIRPSGPFFICLFGRWCSGQHAGLWRRRHGFDSRTSNQFHGGFAPTALRPAPTDFVVARLRRRSLLSRGRMGCAHFIRPPPLGVRAERGSATFEISLTRARMGCAHCIRPPPLGVRAERGSATFEISLTRARMGCAHCIRPPPLGVRAEWGSATFEISLTRARMDCAHCIRPPPLGVRAERGSTTFEISLTRGRMGCAHCIRPPPHGVRVERGSATF